MNPKTKLVNGERIDIATNQPYSDSITSFSLTPQSQFKIPPTVPDTTALGFGTEISAQAKADQEYNDKLKADADKKQAGYDSSRKAMLDIIDSSQGKTAITDSAYSEGGDRSVDTTDAKVQKLNAQIDGIDIALTKQIERLQQQGGGSEVGMNLEIDRLTREASFKKADLQIEKLVALADFNSAKAIADRKIAIQTELEQKKWDRAQFIYEDNKKLFTEAEKRQFESMQADRQNEIQQRNIANKTLSDTKLAMLQSAASQGAPSSILQSIQSATSPEMAIQAAGEYSGDILDRKYKLSQINKNNAGSGGSGGSPYATDLDAIVGSVLSTIPSKFGQETFKNQIAKARDDADKINLVAAQVLKGQPAEFKNDFRNQAVGISNIDKAIAELDKGVQTGVLQNAAQYTYNLVGKDFDPALAKIQGYITSAIQPYRNSVTGAAWGEQEDGEYNSLFGSTKYSPSELRQRLLQTKELLKSKSAEGLNAFVNPLGYYDNAFETGTLTPTAGPTPTPSTDNDPVTRGFWGGIGNWLWGND